MSKKISLTFSDDEYIQLLSMCEKNENTVQDYIRFKLFGNAEKNTITLKTVIKRALAKEKGCEFSIPELFSYSEYEIAKRGVVGTIGRLFYSRVNGGDLSEVFCVLGVRNRQMIYLKLK